MTVAKTPLGTVASPGRHDLLLIAPEDWPEIQATRTADLELDHLQRAELDGWSRAHRPVVVRRSGGCERAEAIHVGVPLPPFLGKRRVGLTLAPTTRWSIRAPVTLVEACSHAPAAWAPTIDALLALGDSTGVQPRVYGALLWQTLTGLEYLHAGSDLDLLWPISDPGTVPVLVAALGRIDAAGHVRIDGELLTPMGGINWRELADPATSDDGAVLVKSLDTARLVSRHDLFRGVAPCC